MHLPTDYLEQMKTWLQDEFAAFLASYEEVPARGLRVNRLKIGTEAFLHRSPFDLTPIPWCPEGFYYDHERDRPGKHVYHAAGLYYIQDPSAMAPAEALDPQPGERVLDLCAAPGGKTTQIAAKMQGKGLLVANEISPQRIKALVENLERCGVTNAVVLNERPERLTERFSGFFDRILIDAPCSGEGMFRKDPEVCERWSVRATHLCADVQMEILSAAAPMLRPGGKLVYSTCTFNPVENEQVITRFLSEHPEFALVSVPQAPHYRPARPEWADGRDTLRLASRLWPHHLRGEGHFVALMEKMDGPEGTKRRSGKMPPVSAEAVKHLRTFAQETLTRQWDDSPLTLYGEHLYRVPDELPSLKGLKVERPGLHLGQVKRNRLEPSHTWAMALKPEGVQSYVWFEVDDPRLYQYLRGETIPFDGDKGWTLVGVEQFPLGWAKVSGGMLKNHYPKWLRWD